MSGPEGGPAAPAGAGHGLVLASASATRAALLAAAGVAATIAPARVDEDEIRRAMRAAGAGADDAALHLARLKAERVARHHPGALVIGADQILECGGAWYEKPRDRDHARAQLAALRGRRHALATAVVVLRDGTRLWHHQARPELTMRTFTDAFLERYLDDAGPGVTDTVGAYRVEGLGIQLFERIAGDHFAVLGLPLLPLLAFLRGHGVVAT